MKLQTGRSMIEMLGVLAIIGVMSIGGIALYRRAVNNHHANTILDDVNRFAFVITERGGFPANTFIDNIQYEQTSTYNLDAFSGVIGGQFGIVATDVPKGVCEALIEKAAVEYKARVIPAETAESVEQLSTTGVVYDSLHTDICNDINDVVLHFGNTIGQCNPKENSPCATNADCCNGQFCAFENATYCNKRAGECQKIPSFDFETVEISGHTWTHSTETMTWWSAKNWCNAIGMRSANSIDLGCEDVFGQQCYTSITTSLKSEWDGYHWMAEPEIEEGTCYGFFFSVPIVYIGADSRTTQRRALCY